MDPEVELLAVNLLKIFEKHSDNKFKNYTIDNSGDLTDVWINGEFNFTAIARELKEME